MPITNMAMTGSGTPAPNLDDDDDGDDDDFPVGETVLAPMVAVGTLPLARSLAALARAANPTDAGL